MKISKLELAVLLFTAAFLALIGGWLLRGVRAGSPVRIEVQRSAGSGQTLRLPEPTSTAASPTAGGEKININTADAETLQTLPGIGEKRAQDIVAYREAHGPFRIPEELTEVRGIGEGTLAGLLDYITVTDP